MPICPGSNGAHKHKHKHNYKLFHTAPIVFYFKCANCRHVSTILKPTFWGS